VQWTGVGSVYCIEKTVEWKSGIQKWLEFSDRAGDAHAIHAS